MLRIDVQWSKHIITIANPLSPRHKSHRLQWIYHIVCNSIQQNDTTFEIEVLPLLSNSTSDKVQLSMLTDVGERYRREATLCRFYRGIADLVKSAYRGTWNALGSSDATDSTVLRHVDPNHPIETSTRAEGVGDHARCLGSVCCFESISSTVRRFVRFVSLTA